MIKAAKRPFLTIAISIMIVVATFSFVELKPAKSNPSPDYMPNEAIVGFYGPIALFQGVPAMIASKYGIALISTSPELSAGLFTNVTESIMVRLREDENVKFVERNYVAEASVNPNDPGWSNQWGPVSIGAPTAWNTVTGSATFRVAVVDTGIDYNHQDLSGNYLAVGWNFVGNNNNPMDDNGHGTHVAGIIGAVGNNGIGIAGMAWTIKLVAEKVLNSAGSGSYWNVALGIVHAAGVGARIINLSLGGSSDSTVLHLAVQLAYAAGCLIVAASGNNGDGILYPAKYTEVIAVGAIDNTDTLAAWSSRGPEQELVAPGVNIYSTLLGNSYGYKSGTSMACPHVVGTAALTWIINPSLSRDEVRCLLRTTATDLGSAGWDQNYGYGKVRADQSVSAANFRFSVAVIPGAQNIVSGGTIAYTIIVTLTSGVGKPVTLAFDPLYAPDSTHFTAGIVPAGGTPPFAATLTITDLGTTVNFFQWLRIVAIYTAHPCITRRSNFFSINVVVPPPVDVIYIKTCATDNGNTPRTCTNWWGSPDILSVPSTPVRGQTNTLYVTVRNKAAVASGPVNVRAWFNSWNAPPNVLTWYTTALNTIPNIPASSSVIVAFSWYIPTNLQEHICVFAQAWRVGFEPFDSTFDIINNNNVAQRNFITVPGSSPSKTTLRLENFLNHTLNVTLYATCREYECIIDICRPSTWNYTHLITPLTLAPGEYVDLKVTVFRPAFLDYVLVDIYAKIDGYDYIYQELSGCTIKATKPQPPVGGIQIPIDKLGLLAPFIGLASALATVGVATAVCFKRVKRRKENR